MSKITKRISFRPNGDICGIRVEHNDRVMLLKVCSKKLKAFCEDGPYSITEFMDIKARTKISKKGEGILFEAGINRIYFESKNLKGLLSSVSKELS